MYGHVVINKSELKFREYDVYRSFYCGLCRNLKNETGFLSSLGLSYDMTFLAILLNSLYEGNLKCEKRRCVCHVCKKHTESSDNLTKYVAHMSTLLTYYKCIDDFKDDKNILKLIASFYLKPKVKKIEKLYYEKSKNIHSFLKKLSERENVADIEECANLFGNILSEVFAPYQDMWTDILKNMGFYLGKFIYIADAFVDLPEDIKKNRPNPLKAMAEENRNKECEIILNMMAAEAASEFEKLPLIENVEILRNILYGGIWTKLNSPAKGA
jgi:hypothetical protein